MTFFFLEHEVTKVDNQQGILLDYEKLRQCTMLPRVINNKLTSYRDFLSGGANIQSQSGQMAHVVQVYGVRVN